MLVVRADEYSGSLITAEHALAQGRDVFAVPGRIDEPLSRGVNKLLRQGAIPVSCAEDVLAEYQHQDSFRANLFRQEQQESTRLRAGSRPRQKSKSALPQQELSSGLEESLTGEQQEILALLTQQPAHADAIAARTGQTVAQVLSTLTELELYGLVENRGLLGYALA